MWFDRDVCFRLEDSVARATGSQFYGPQIASHYELPQLGWWGKSIAQSPNLLAGLQFASQTIDTLQKGTQFRARQASEEPSLQFQLSRPRIARPDPAYLRDAGGAPEDRLDDGRARMRSRSRSRVPIRRCSTACTLISARRYRMTATPMASCSTATSSTRGSTASRRTPTPFLDTTHDAIALIASMLPYEHPTRERVAKRLKISARTLQRRLNDWGVTFEELVDEYRRDRAFGLLIGAGPQHSGDRVFARLFRSRAFHACVQALDRDEPEILSQRNRERACAISRSAGASVAHGVLRARAMRRRFLHEKTPPFPAGFKFVIVRGEFNARQSYSPQGSHQDRIPAPAGMKRLRRNSDSSSVGSRST